MYGAFYRPDFLFNKNTRPGACFKTHGRAFQALEQAFQTLDRAFEALRENQKLSREFEKLSSRLFTRRTWVCVTTRSMLSQSATV